ncbi:PIG-L deacetylase family protein [Streptomyces sp. NRRL S-237]|uniref:PIG-L deacetylase family protein n=1 Tax=Streptomyces sp. NRRL S-237 TaxID=1463895 RepID=UPI0007C4AD29|nr:hypothetical protein [Streptomyces sp. NRRL S-237]
MPGPWAPPGAGTPDDESLWSGGVLARHAASGARTAVVTTAWDASTPRAAELAHALEILGAGKPRMLGYADTRAPESAPGLELLYPDTGAPLAPSAPYLATHPHTAARQLSQHLTTPGKPVHSVPDEHVTATLDVTP